MRERLTFYAFTDFGWPNGGSHGLWGHPELVTPRPIGDLPGDLDAEIRAGRTLLYDRAVQQERGLAQREYTPGPLRHEVMGYGDRLPSRHPAARHRRTPVAA